MANLNETIRRPEIGPVKEGVTLEVRSPAEVEAIKENLLILCGGDESKAGLLYFRVMVSFYGQTWGKSLLVSGSESLPEIELVITRAARILHEGEASWRDYLARTMAKEVGLRPCEVSFIYAMVADLAGESGVALFNKEVLEKMGLVLLPQAGEMGRKTYEKIVGRSYWEMDEGSLAKLTMIYYSAYLKRMSAKVCDNKRDWLEKSAADLRTRLREIAAVVLGRGLVWQGGHLAGMGATLTYADLINLLN